MCLFHISLQRKILLNYLIRWTASTSPAIARNLWKTISTPQHLKQYFNMCRSKTKKKKITFQCSWWVNHRKFSLLNYRYCKIVWVQWKITKIWTCSWDFWRNMRTRSCSINCKVMSLQPTPLTLVRSSISKEVECASVTLLLTRYLASLSNP